MVLLSCDLVVIIIHLHSQDACLYFVASGRLSVNKVTQSSNEVRVS